MIKKMTRRGYTQITVNKKGHSREISGPQGSAIYNVCRDKNKDILDSFQDLQRTSLLFLNNRRGRWQIKSAMTSLFNNGTGVEDAQQQPLSIRLCYKKAFTLIELLVVVLIIGILAAVAVPQYQKVVYKARATEAVIILKALVQAEETYFLANGTYTNTLDNLDVSIPESKEYIVSCSTGGCLTWPKNYNYKLPLFQFNFSNREEGKNPDQKRSLRMCVAVYNNETADSICKGMTKQDPLVCDSHCYYSIDL